MDDTVKELADRWILPLRGSVVTEIAWDDAAPGDDPVPDRDTVPERDTVSAQGTGPDDIVRLRLDPEGEIAVGSGALLTRGPLSAPVTEVRTLGELGPEGSQHVIGTGIVSAVGFKNGALRVVFANSWQLSVRASGVFVPASVTIGLGVTWSRDPDTSGERT
jgi:hypothetical protein